MFKLPAIKFSNEKAMLLVDARYYLNNFPPNFVLNFLKIEYVFIK